MKIEIERCLICIGLLWDNLRIRTGVIYKEPTKMQAKRKLIRTSIIWIDFLQNLIEYVDMF